MKIRLLGQDNREEIERQIQIVAAAGKLSRFPGTAMEIYESSIDYDKNIKFIERVTNMGHKSITEHDYIVIALEDVTPVVEQALIENRLCSFTIKSRREVDFRTAGFHTPNFRNMDYSPHEDNEKLQELYKKNMQGLFDTYSNLVDSGVPKEDARYVLPYCFHSNIIMGFDVRELEKITKELLYGELAKVAELRAVGKAFYEIIAQRAPYLVTSILKGNYDETDHFAFLDRELYGEEANLGEICSTSQKLDGAHITEHTSNPDDTIIVALLQKRYQLSGQEAWAKYCTMSDETKKKTMNSIAETNEKDARALEHATFKVEFPVSLANATHFARHRMHSPMFPKFIPMWNLDNYVTPENVRKCALEQYDEAYFDNKAMYEEFKARGVNPADLVYFYQAGNTMNVTSVLNARFLMHFCALRRCNKAQWEIRGIANSIASEAAEIAPLLSEHLGPSCMTIGKCNEGRESCGKPIAPFVKQIKE